MYDLISQSILKEILKRTWKKKSWKYRPKFGSPWCDPFLDPLQPKLGNHCLSAMQGTSVKMKQISFERPWQIKYKTRLHYCIKMNSLCSWVYVCYGYHLIFSNVFFNWLYLSRLCFFNEHHKYNEVLVCWIISITADYHVCILQLSVIFRTFHMWRHVLHFYSVYWAFS